MSNILLPEGVNEEPKVENQSVEEAGYNATEEDEERFFLMYQMNLQPSEVERLSPSYRKWLIARFVAQKNMEREMIDRQRLMQQLGPNLKG